MVRARQYPMRAPPKIKSETKLDFSLKPRIQPAASYALARPWKRDLLGGAAAEYGTVGGVNSSFCGDSEAYGK